MRFQEFPTDVIRRLFPNGGIGRGGTEINELPENAETELTLNSNVKGIWFVTDYSKYINYQNHFILETLDGFFVYGRICTAMEGSGYAKFVVIFEVTNSPSDTEHWIYKMNMYAKKNPKFNTNGHSNLIDTSAKELDASRLTMLENAVE